MRNMSAQGRATMAKRRDFVNYARMTLADGTVLNLQPKDFRISGNTFTDDLVSGDSFEVGTAIGKTVNIRLDNTDERFSQYDFYMARFFLYLHLPEAYEDDHGVLQDEIFSLGLFTVTEPTTTGVVIDIAGIDEMYKFDTSFDACTLDFSTRPTLYTILARCCTDCDVAIGFSTFDNSTMTVTNRPEGVTYREVVSFVCQMAGMNARISPTGALTLVWYNTSALPTGLDGGTFSNPGSTSYQDGDTADGGTFDSGSTGYVYDGGSFDSPVGFHQLSQVKGLTVSTDDIHITGVKVTNEDTSVIAGQTFNAVKLKFGPNCKTENMIDFVRIYCKSGDTYRYTNKYTGGRSGTPNTIANKEVIIPSDEFYVYWYTDSSITDYGFDIASIEPVLVNSADLWNDFSGTSALPSYTPIELNGISTKPETSHPYKNEERILWHWNTLVITNRSQYIIEVKDNPFTVDKQDAIASFLYNKLASLVFRPFSCSYLQDPTIEAGDAAIVWDIKGNSYKTIITNVKFDTNAMMNVASKAQSPAKQQSSFKNSAARAVVEARRNTEKQIDTYTQTVDHFNEIANNALGYYKTETTEQGATITYYHDAPTLSASTNIVKITGAGIFISDDGGQSYSSGYETSTATMLLNLVYAHGITADWVTSGLFQDKQGKFVLDIDNSTLKLDLTSQVGNTTLGGMINKISANESGLSAEITRATNAEGSLSTRITANANGLSSEVTRAKSAEGELNSIYSGAYTPTTSNSPASAWTTTTLKQKHINDVFYNTSNGNTYQWRNTSGNNYEWTLRQDIQTMNSSISQTASQIALKVSKGDVSSQLSVESGQITLDSNRLVVNSTNFKLTADGYLTCYGATVNGNVITAGTGRNVWGHSYNQRMEIKSGSIEIWDDYDYNSRGGTGSYTLAARLKSLTSRYRSGTSYVTTHGLSIEALSGSLSLSATRTVDIESEKSILIESNAGSDLSENIVIRALNGSISIEADDIYLAGTIHKV